VKFTFKLKSILFLTILFAAIVALTVQPAIADASEYAGVNGSSGKGSSSTPTKTPQK